MLDTLRKRTGGWTARILIAILVISFAVWGIPGILDQPGGRPVAVIGETEISALQFQEAYQREVQSVSQQLGRGITPTEAVNFNLPNVVLGRLALTATLDDHATALGLGLTDEGVGRAILADPNFQTGSGQFNTAGFNSFLRQNNLSEGAYIRTRREQELRTQIVAAVADRLGLPAAYDQLLHSYDNEARTIRYVTLTPDTVEAAPEPTEEELTAYFEENAANWSAAETRSLAVTELNPAVFADPSTVTEEEAEAAYQARIATFSTAETRRVRQVVFPTRARADEVAALLAAGQTFDQLVEAGEIAPADLGVVDRNDLRDPAVAEAAFALAEGETSAVFDGRAGATIVNVSAINAPVVTPFEEVRDDLVQTLAEEHAVTEVNDLHPQIEDALAGGATVTAIAEQFGLPLTIIPSVDASGNDIDGNPVTVPGGQQLVNGAFASDVGLSNPPIQQTRWSFVWYDVTEVSPPHQRPLDEVRDAVVAAWQQDSVATRLAILAGDMLVRVRAGATFEEAADALGLAVTVETAEGLTRGGTVPESLSSAAVQTAFTGPEGYVDTAAAPDGESAIVLQVVAVSLPEGEPDAALAGDVATEFSDDMFRAYAQAVQNEMNVTINPAALEAAIGL
ncbi:MAG: SurA N-terminal domain-containing protein [Bauldia sp.]|nr:SurA N-terminal domain-containing protein [Bauldia sp.]